jgi:hypothetical protein
MGDLIFEILTGLGVDGLRALRFRKLNAHSSAPATLTVAKESLNSGQPVYGYMGP